MSRINLDISDECNITLFKNRAYKLLVMSFTDSSGSAIDLTGKTINAQIKKSYSDPRPLATFATSGTLGTGSFGLTLTTTQTNALVASTYVWDAEVLPDSYNLLQGLATVKSTVSQ